MRIQKIKDTFNDYRVELSWGQLNSVYHALEPDHSDPLADELFAELGWYLQNVPGPGEDEEEYKEAKDAEKASIEGGEGEGGAGPDQELLGQEVEGSPQEPEGTESPAGAEQPEPPEPHEEEADRFLERPPEREPVAA